MKLIEQQKQYAAMLISALNLQKGQNMVITGEACHWYFINMIAAAAYQQGAQYVEVQSSNSGLLQARATYSEEHYLDYAPSTLPAKQAIYVKERWARLAISSQENPDALSNIDNTRNMRIQTAARRSQELYRRAIMSDQLNWLVCMMPTPGWAAKVLHCAPSTAAARRLWKLLLPILRLNRPNPLQALESHCKGLNRRAEQLSALKIRLLRFKGRGTDLKVHLDERARWKGGYSTTPQGVRFLPNFPTEEVFTTPDCRKTEGEVRLTRPAVIYEKMVEDVELEFHNGKVSKVKARRGQEVLEGLLKSDEGASAVGEIALVDCSSPIYQAQRIFHNILLDENAACHFAFGGAYPNCIEGGVAMTNRERLKVGINQSIVHSDVMIGSDRLDVEATLADGRRKMIIEQGRFRDL